MIIKDTAFGGTNWGPCEVQASRYVQGGIAIRLVSKSGEPLTTVTVNLPDTPPAEGAFWLKSWGENSGLLVLLASLALIEFKDSIRTVDMNAYGSQAIETYPLGELKDLIDAEMASW